MNLTAWVDVAIGLTLIYLGAGLLVTLLSLPGQQWLTGRRGVRADDEKRHASNEGLPEQAMTSSPQMFVSYRRPQLSTIPASRPGFIA